LTHDKVLRTRRRASAPTGFTRGMLTGYSEHGEPLVDFPGNPAGQPAPAVSTVPLEAAFAGRECVLAFEDGDAGRPILVGLTQAPLAPEIVSPQKSVETVVDGKRLVLTAEDEIVLRCGRASITLTRAGKILIRGAYLLNRSSGVNRIKGGSVQIN
jgi:Domain of unknown function (DUF6484)